MPDDFEWPDHPAWETRYSLEFLQQMQREQWRTRRAEVVEHLRVLLADPLTALHSERLLRDHRGLRSARIGWRYRLLYKVCGECRSNGDEARFTLACCLDQGAQPTADQIINVLYVSDHYGDTPDNFEIEEPPGSIG